MRRTKRRSVRFEVVLLSIFIVSIGGYVAIANISASGMFATGNVDAAADAACASSYKKFKSQAQSNPKKYGDPTKYADKMNSQVPCSGKGGSGHCNAVEGSQSPKDICGAEKDSKGEPLQPPKMPEKQPKQDQPKDQPCPATTTLRTYGLPVGQTNQGINPLTGQPCSSNQNSAANFNPANFLPSGFEQTVKDFIASTFGFNVDNPNQSHEQAGTFSVNEIQEIAQQQITVVNGNPTLSTQEKQAVVQYIQARADASKPPLTTTGVANIARQLPDDLLTQTKAIRHAIETNTLLPTTGEFNTSTQADLQANKSIDIGARVWNFVKGLFGR